MTGTRILLKKSSPLATSGSIFFVGDSITVGANCVEDGGYVTKTINLLNQRSAGLWYEKPIRIARGGKSTWELAGFIDDDLASRSDIPDFVFLYSGANDMWPPPYNGSVFIDATWETSWKAAYTYIIEAIHTKYPSALQFIGKSYRCDPLTGAVNTWFPQYIYPWTDDLVSSISYLRAGIEGYTILQTGFPESMGGDSVHPACAGHALLAEGIVSQIFRL
jgi:lysophospholipase L1-like esterase